jgi:hypothetical protein
LHHVASTKNFPLIWLDAIEFHLAPPLNRTPPTPLCPPLQPTAWAKHTTTPRFQPFLLPQPRKSSRRTPPPMIMCRPSTPASDPGSAGGECVRRKRACGGRAAPEARPEGSLDIPTCLAWTLAHPLEPLTRSRAHPLDPLTRSRAHPLDPLTRSRAHPLDPLTRSRAPPACPRPMMPVGQGTPACPRPMGV